MTALSVLLWIVAIVLIVVGVAGSFLPALPGAVLVFAGVFVAAWADGFAHIGWPTLLILAALTGLTYVVDLAASAFGTRRAGASRRSAWGAAVGALVGLFFGLPGLILGPFLGAVIGELTARRPLREASRAGFGAWVGLLLGGVLRLALIFAMLGIFGAAFVL